MKILVINGVNLNMLGIRERNLYGNKMYKDLIKFIKKGCKDKSVKLKFYQSNYEGDIVTVIQKAMGRYDGIVINPGLQEYYIPRNTLLFWFDDEKMKNPDFSKAGEYAFRL